MSSIHAARMDARAALFGRARGRSLSLSNAPQRRGIPSPPRGNTMQGSAGGRNVYSGLNRIIPDAR